MVLQCFNKYDNQCFRSVLRNMTIYAFDVSRQVYDTEFKLPTCILLIYYLTYKTHTQHGGSLHTDSFRHRRLKGALIILPLPG